MVQRSVSTLPCFYLSRRTRCQIATSLFVFILFLSSFLSINKRVYTPTATISVSLLFLIYCVCHIGCWALSVTRWYRRLLVSYDFTISFSILLTFRELIWMQHFQFVAFFFCRYLLCHLSVSGSFEPNLYSHIIIVCVCVCLSNANEQTQSHQSQSTEAAE